jgi:hypothetical protein
MLKGKRRQVAVGIGLHLRGKAEVAQKVGEFSALPLGQPADDVLDAQQRVIDRPVSLRDSVGLRRVAELLQKVEASLSRRIRMTSQRDSY